jgi:protein-tyrosine phosphatase
MKKVIFVCTANYYRSRFAQAWFNFRKGTALENWHAESRGLMIECAPASISPHTKDLIDEYKIPKSCYQKLPIALTLEDLESADLVIALKTQEHHPMMQKQFPEWVDRIRYWDVHDMDVWEPSQTIPAIMIQVGLLIAELS